MSSSIRSRAAGTMIESAPPSKRVGAASAASTLAASRRGGRAAPTGLHSFPMRGRMDPRRGQCIFLEWSPDLAGRQGGRADRRLS